MKINSSIGILGYPVHASRDKSDGQSPQQENSQQKQSKGDHPEQDEQSQSTPEKVDQEVSAFQSELEAQANGLSATVTGNGPGLKVVLKDGSGGVVRQFTGEEFLRLRQATSKDGRIRGKILDQKL